MSNSVSTTCNEDSEVFPGIGDRAPDSVARITHGRLQLSSLRGCWAMLFSHPADFTPVCTDEFLAFSLAFNRFKESVLLALSAGSLPAHPAWIEAIRAQFGVTVRFPIIEYPSMTVARAYGMLDLTAQSSATVRTLHIFDPEGIIRAITWYPMSVGRSVTEMLRLVAAPQKVAQDDVLTPEGWNPGDATVLPAVQTQEDAAAAGPA